MKKYKLSKRGELLAIRVKNKIDQLKAAVPRPAPGIPLNALPGWNDVPLYEKLPMLDCPNNQIVFTNSVIGRGLPKFSSEYDTNCQNDINEYNSLNDPHLRNFYSRERNIDLLKRYGIITKDNYVICNLYEFNAYRRQLNRFHLFLIHKELKRRETEQQDRASIAHAEKVAKKEYGNRIFKADYHDPVKQKAQLHQVSIEQRQIIANDLLRKNVIEVKRHLKYMSDLSAKHMKTYKDNKLRKSLEKKSIQWNKRIQNTIETHKKNTALMVKNETIKRNNIKRRIQKSRKRWQRIQKRIAQNSQLRTPSKPKISIEEKITRKLRRETKDSRKRGFSISKLTCKDIEDAVNTAIDLQEDLYCQHTSGNIYEAAKYIIEQVLANIDYDLNYNKNYFYVVSQTVDEIFGTIKQITMQKVKLVLKDFKSLAHTSKTIKDKRTSCTRSVSFCEFSSVIGTSALQEEYNMFCGPIKIKSVKERPPTPAGSLTSITVALEEATDEKPIIGDTFISHKERNEKIFLGHFLIKFKRQLLVGVSQKVFQSLKEYDENHVFKINEELLEIDTKYLRNEVTKSILSYNINKYDFQTNLRFCISALSSHILWELQQDICDSNIYSSTSAKDMSPSV